MKRLLVLIAALTLALGALAPYVSAHAAQPAVQDDEAKKAHDALYKEWYKVSQVDKNYPEAVKLAKQYLEKYPSGQYANYMKQWLGSLPMLRVQFATAVQDKNKAESLRLLREILAVKDLTEQDRLDYLWFMTTDLTQSEIFTNPGNFSHAAEVTEFSKQILPMVEAGKKPSNVKPEDWKKNTVVAYLNQTLATIETNNKNLDKALEYYGVALKADPANVPSAFACGKIHYDSYGAAIKTFRDFPEADQQAAADKKPDAKPEVVAALDKVNKEADAVIDCWAKYLVLTESAPNATRTQVESAVEKLYKYRHPDSTETIQQVINRYKTGTPAPSTPPAQPPNGTPKPPQK